MGRLPHPVPAVLSAIGAGPRATVGLGAIQMALRWRRSAEELADAAHRLAAQARTAGADIVVYPECIGLILTFADDPEVVGQASDIRQAIAMMVERRGQTVMTMMESYPVGPTRALLFARSEATRRRYEAIFSGIARSHGLYVVAGTAPLGRRGSGTAAAFATSSLFAPSGEVLGSQAKVNLAAFETLGGLDLSSGKPDDCAAVRTPLGMMGIAPGDDAADEDVTMRLAREGARILAVPVARPCARADGDEQRTAERVQAWCDANQGYAVRACAVGDLGGMALAGQSAVYGPAEGTPDGANVLARARTYAEEEVVVAAVELQR